MRTAAVGRVPLARVNEDTDYKAADSKKVEKAKRWKR